MKNQSFSKNQSTATATETSKITTRLFAGCQITSEVRMHLNQSIQWKHAGIDAELGSDRMQEVHYRDKDYFGFYYSGETIGCKDLNGLQHKIRGELKLYCPDLETDHCAVYIFPQFFVA